MSTCAIDRSSLLVIIAIALVALGMWLFALSPVAMGILVALLGMFTFASVPALQARLIAEAEHHAPQAHGVAAGLNIAGFNLGIALGSMLGSLTLGTAGIIYMGATGALVSALGLGLLVLLITRAKIGK